MLTVGGLIEKLKKLNKNMPVVINDTVVVDIVEVCGKIGGGYWNENFRLTPKGNPAITFTHSTEGSDGEYYQTSFWS